VDLVRDGRNVLARVGLARDEKVVRLEMGEKEEELSERVVQVVGYTFLVRGKALVLLREAIS
jgi:hypothetical protein